MSNVRQQILDAIETRLKLIVAGKVWTLPDSTTRTSVTTVKDVYPWRKVPLTPALCPAIAIYDTTSNLEDGTFGSFNHALEISIIGFIASSSPISAARELASDILACIGSDHRWSGLARWSEIQNMPLDMEQAGDVVAAGEIKLTVHYRTGLWQI